MRNRRGFTLIEVLVVLAIGGVVFGLVIDALIQTDRTSRGLVLHQQMRQEAVIISNTVEKALRQSVWDQQRVAGGAGQPAPAAGGGKESPQIPQSLGVTGMTTAVLNATPGPEATSPTEAAATPLPSFSTNAKNTTVPASVRSLFTTAPAEIRSTPRANPGTTGTTTLLGSRSLSLSTLAFGTANGTQVELANDGEPGSQHVLLKSASGNARKLGAMSDRLQSEILFRYADSFNGLDAVWSDSSSTPRIVEYTVRVWPAGAKHPTFDTAIADDGKRERFSMTSAVAVP